MRIELSLKVTYLPEWDVWCGVRELLQNARDAREEFGASLEVTHSGKVLSIKSTGASLSHRDLLLGQTSKYGRSDLAGKFGEGLKLGVLALVRAGHKIKIRTGGEIWTPVIQRSDTFHEDVLVFQIRKARKSDEADAVDIQIDGVDKETWEKLRPRLLFLTELPDAAVKVYDGTLILDPAYTGMIFVKGIYVNTDPELVYGYDFRDADVDRDRKMVASWDLKWKCRQIWQSAAVSRPDLLAKFNHLLTEQRADLAGVDDWSGSQLPEPVRQYVAEQFQVKFGEQAVPVTNLSESAEVEHLGKKGIVVHKGLGAVLSSVLGSTETIKEQLKNEATRKYGWHELDDTEKASLQAAIALLGKVVEVSLDEIDVADFRDERTMGLYEHGHVLIGKKHLADQDATLKILLHEVAHREGNDGSKSHVATIERLWSGIVSHLRQSC
jgi:hypothetical protein